MSFNTTFPDRKAPVTFTNVTLSYDEIRAIGNLLYDFNEEVDKVPVVESEIEEIYERHAALAMTEQELNEMNLPVDKLKISIPLKNYPAKETKEMHQNLFNKFNGLIRSMELVK